MIRGTAAAQAAVRAVHTPGCAQAQPRVRAIVAGLIAAAAAKGTVEVVSEIAAPLPSMVIAELLGFDRAQWPSACDGPR